MTDEGRRRLMAVLIVALLSGAATGVAEARGEIVFVDWTWDSAFVHNRIAGFIAEHGFGYQADYVMADTVPGLQGMRRGEIDVTMETWLDNTPDIFQPYIDDGTLIDLGPNFEQAPQGWYVPTYVIEGDPERNIEPMAPNLRSVFDMAEHWELFRDPEFPRKGRFYNGLTGWVMTEYNAKKLAAYGLDGAFENFHPGSQAALDASIARAYERGEPWFGYYWEPTWIMGKYDMTRLEEPAHGDACWNEAADTFACAAPAVDVLIMATRRFIDRADSALIDFLRAYETELHHTNHMLAHMEDTGASPEETALWFLRTYESLWTSWLDDDAAARVKAALR